MISWLPYICSVTFVVKVEPQQTKSSNSSVPNTIFNSSFRTDFELSCSIFRRCDDCQKNYHFRCLIPPLKKTPKRRGYSWHCADCDPTVMRIYNTFVLSANILSPSFAELNLKDKEDKWNELTDISRIGRWSHWNRITNFQNYTSVLRTFIRKFWCKA